MAQAPEAAQALLTQACQQAVARFGADAVIVGGAGLAGMAARIQREVPVPVIDSVSAGVHYALNGPPAMLPTRRPFDFQWAGVSDELMALGARAPQPLIPA